MIKSQEITKKNLKTFNNFLDLNEETYLSKESETVVKELKNNDSSGVDSMVNGFLKHGGYKARIPILKITGIIFEKAEVSRDFKRTLSRTLYKKLTRVSEVKRYCFDFFSNQITQLDDTY